MTGLKRTNYCGDFTIDNVGQEVVVAGWVQRQRDLGALIFIDLRDRSGIVQLSFGESTDKEVFEKAFGARSEYVLMAKGVVKERSSKNKDIPTGEIEIDVTDLRVLGKSETPPFEIVADCHTSELTRLKYRYLDLRRPDLQANILMRHKITKIIRDYFDENGFIEIETPMLIKSTPEGARDFLVPSRIHKGSFYALPQSPQLYKQLSMVAGFDRYMQIARCFRDEDLRADRQPEFTQIDVEMSFVDMEDILDMIEKFIIRLFKEALGVDVNAPFVRMTYADAMNKYGSDKPDTRYDMEICDISEEVKSCGFGVFTGAIENGGKVCAINAKNGYSKLTRKEIDKLVEYVRGIGAKGLAFMRIAQDGTVASSFAKFMSEDEMAAIMAKTDAKPGDVILIVADKAATTLSVLGSLRQTVAAKLDIIPQDKYNLLWIVEFPFFDWDEDEGQFVAMHHPFTSPMDDCDLEGDKANVRAKAYDLVLNGVELASGSIRITNPDLQKRMFTMLGFSDEEAQEKFGFLTDAFKYGAPPHGGIGLGLDRLIMQMLRLETLRDVVAYPKVQNASEPMTQCPALVDEIQLGDLGIACIKE
ncbi:MAG: aspartate--tRNA ligase [Clostridia bacterium]